VTGDEISLTGSTEFYGYYKLISITMNGDGSMSNPLPVNASSTPVRWSE
jgi:hypothetical protein